MRANSGEWLDTDTSGQPLTAADALRAPLSSSNVMREKGSNPDVDGDGGDPMSREVLFSALAAPVISGLVAFLIVRTQIRVKVRELENFYLDVGARLESHRQAQFQEVLRARILAYPLLWKEIIEHTTNWPYKRRKRDDRWVLEFIEAVDNWSAENGVFLSEASYLQFRKFRAALSRIARNTAPGETVGFDEYEKIFRLFSGDRKSRSLGLATQLKWDLGSYGEALIRSAEFVSPRELLRPTRRKE